MRLGHDRLVLPPGEVTTRPHIVDTGVLFVRPKQRLLRGFLESLRDRLLAGDTASVGALAAIVAHEPSRLRMPDDRPEAWQRVGRSLLARIPTVARETEIWRAHLRLTLAVHRPERAPQLLKEAARDIRDMARGGLMLRCAREGRELTYRPIGVVTQHGPRPPRLPRQTRF